MNAFQLPEPRGPVTVRYDHESSSESDHSMDLVGAAPFTFPFEGLSDVDDDDVLNLPAKAQVVSESIPSQHDEANFEIDEDEDIDLPPKREIGMVSNTSTEPQAIELSDDEDIALLPKRQSSTAVPTSNPSDFIEISDDDDDVTLPAKAPAIAVLTDDVIDVDDDVDLQLPPKRPSLVTSARTSQGHVNVLADDAAPQGGSNLSETVSCTVLSIEGQSIDESYFHLLLK